MALEELRHRSISEPMHMSKSVAEPVRRIEVFTGAGRRRAWTQEEKAEIVAESFSGFETVCGVARRHGLTPQQLFAWRRRLRGAVAARPEAAVPAFVPAVLDAPSPELVREATGGVRSRRYDNADRAIELEIGGVLVRIGRGAEAETIAAVIRALKAAL